MDSRQIKLLGLTANEAKVAKVLGHLPLSQIEVEKKTKLPHASVVDTLRRFVERGLVKVLKSQQRKTYVYYSKAVFAPVATQVSSLGTEVEVYDGKEALLSLISKELVKHRHDRLLSFHGEAVGEGWLGILDPKEIQKRNELIIEHDIIVERFVPSNGYRALFKKFPRAWQKTMVGRSHITHFLPDDYFQTKTELMMFSDVVMVYETHKQRITAFRDKETVKLYTALFEILRLVGKKVNSEVEFQKYLTE